MSDTQKCQLSEAHTYTNLISEIESSLTNINSNYYNTQDDIVNYNTAEKVEEPDKCVITDENPYNIETVKTGEICTIQTAKEYGIFGKNSYFNNLLPIDEALKIDLLKNNNYTKDAKYALCSLNNNNIIAYENCALSTNNPWKSINTSNNSCMIPLDITLPSQLKYNTSTKLIEKGGKIPIYKDKNLICQERWYDWFSIPDYHFGNSYISYDKKCYMPCKIGNVPTTKEVGLFGISGIQKDRCISKDIYEMGFYSGTFPYLPIQLIVLLGSTKSSLLKKYDDIMTTTREKFEGYSADFDLYSSIVSDNDTKTNIYNSIKADISVYIKDLFNLPFDEDNIIPPNKYVQTLAINADLNAKDRILDAYNIAQNFSELYKATDKEGMLEYLNWKKEISDISGFSIEDTKFYKQLLILKKACNVAFDNSTLYSKNTIMYILNNGEDSNNTKPPIYFDITQNDIILSKSYNNSQNTDKKELISDEEVNRLLLTEVEKSSKVVSESKYNIEFNKPEGAFTKYDDIQPVVNTPKNNTDIAKRIVITLAVIILLMFFASILFSIMHVLWTPLSAILNNIILGAIYFATYIKYLFKGEYDASTFELDLLTKQQDFLTRKIDKDIIFLGYM